MKKMMLILLLVMSSACTVKDKEPLTSNGAPSDFKFSLNFGINGINMVSTYNETFSTGVSEDETYTVEFMFTQSQIDDIYAALMNGGIHKIKDGTKLSELMIIPSEVYIFRYTLGGETKEMICYQGGDSKEAKEFLELVEVITNIVKESEAYKNSPYGQMLFE